MPISELATNPFWELMYGTHQIAGLLVLALAIRAVVDIWYGHHVQAGFMAAGAVLMGFIAHQLTFVEMAQPRIVPALLVWLAAVTVLVPLVQEASRRNLVGVLKYAFLFTAAFAIGLELFAPTSGGLALVNAIWWLATVLVLALCFAVANLYYLNVATTSEDPLSEEDGSRRRVSSPEGANIG